MRDRLINLIIHNDQIDHLIKFDRFDQLNRLVKLIDQFWEAATAEIDHFDALNVENGQNVQIWQDDQICDPCAVKTWQFVKFWRIHAEIDKIINFEIFVAEGRPDFRARLKNAENRDFEIFDLFFTCVKLKSSLFSVLRFS